MKRKSKLISVFLMFAMLITQLPFTAFAESTLTTELSRDEDGNYLIGTADELFRFNEFVSEKVQQEYDESQKNGTTMVRENINAKLTADINLNPGLIVSYSHQTGKVTISKDGKLYRMGTGLKNTTLGKLEDKDGNYYYVDDNKKKQITTEYVEKQLGLKSWTPIAPKITAKNDVTGEMGEVIRAYVGCFDGNGHTVDGMYVYNGDDSASQNVGFVRTTSTSVYKDNSLDAIKNLTVGENSLITSTYQGSSVGGIVGNSGYDKISNCVNKATIVANTFDSSHDGFGDVTVGLIGHVGGISGMTYGTISQCKNYGTVISPQAAAGIVGNVMKHYYYCAARVEYCENHGNVYADTLLAGSRAGGISVNSGGSRSRLNTIGGCFFECMNFGDVEAYSAAGIVEQISDRAYVLCCGNLGEILGNCRASGLVGKFVNAGNSVSLEASYNAAGVTISSTTGNAYPIVAEIENNASHTVEQCYNDSDKCPINLLVADGITTTDCLNVPTETFASGEITDKMNTKSEIPLSWRQNLAIPAEEGKVPETYPTLTGTRFVRKCTLYCCHTDNENKENHKKTIYTNSGDKITAEHTPNENGICTHCELYVKPPVITTDTLKKAKVGKSYQASIFMSEYSSKTYEIVKSEEDDTPVELPEGLNLVNYSYWPEIRGIPAVAGTYTFALKATNDFGTTKKNFTLTIDAADKLTIDNKTLEHGIVGCSYWESFYINLSGDAVWEITAGSLPEGITLDEKNGILEGTPVEGSEKTYTFTVQVSIYGQVASKEFTLLVFPIGGCTHENAVEKHSAVTATCKEPGMAEYWSCNICGGKWRDEAKENGIWDFPNGILTYSNHKDDDGNGLCDFCERKMPVFKKVTSEEDMTAGGTYIFVSKIGEKYYALAAPISDSSKGGNYVAYKDKMPMCEITPNENGYFELNSLVNDNVMIMKSDFCPECSELNRGLPRYSMSTIVNSKKYVIESHDYGPTIALYSDNEAKYGLRMLLNDDGNVNIASIYCSYWSEKTTEEDIGLIRAYDMTYNGVNEKFMSQCSGSYYNGEKGQYPGATIEQCDIQLYKMVDVGMTAKSKKYIASDGKNNIDYSKYAEAWAGIKDAEMSSVDGIVDAVSQSFVLDAVSKFEADTALSYNAEAYAKIKLTDAVIDESSKEVSSLTYSIKPYIRVMDENGTEIGDCEIPNDTLNGKSMSVNLHIGAIQPQQIIHYKKDGTKEYFYDISSDEVRNNGKKSFVYTQTNATEGFVSFEITSFSEIKVLSEAEEELAYSAEIEDIYLQLPVGYNTNDVNALNGNGFNRHIKIKNIGGMTLSMKEPSLINLTPATDKITVSCTSVPISVTPGNISNSYYIAVEPGLEEGIYTATLSFTDAGNKLAQAVTANLTVVVGDCGIKSVDKEKVKAEIGFLKAGEYTVIFADYDDDKLNEFDVVKKTITANDTGIKTVEAGKAMTFGKDDKVMVWNGLDLMTPLCKTYTVK